MTRAFSGMEWTASGPEEEVGPPQVLSGALACSWMRFSSMERASSSPLHRTGS